MNAEHDCENRFVNRLTQTRGPTPEFVRWSIDLVCELRQPLETFAPEKVERYLRPLTAVGQCLTLGRVVDDVCIAIPGSADESARGCFLKEITDFYGGLEFCRSQCQDCPANIAELDPLVDLRGAKSLAGCYGWLIREEDAVRKLATISDAQFEKRTSSSDVFRATLPPWYRLWSLAKLEGSALEIVGGLFDRLLEPGNLPPDWSRFHAATKACRTHGWTLSVQLVPAGHTVGTEWVVGPYCPDCRAPMEVGWKRCTSCGRHGHAHPAVRRKVLGQRPFLQLDALVGAERARQLVSRLEHDGKTQ